MCDTQRVVAHSWLGWSASRCRAHTRMRVSDGLRRSLRECARTPRPIFSHNVVEENMTDGSSLIFSPHTCVRIERKG